MALPLLWLGAAALSALAVKEMADDRENMQNKRKRDYKALTLDELSEHDSPIAIYPSDILTSFDKSNASKVKPQVGAIICCGLGGVLDHTGIYVGDDTIVELSGSGLVKAISTQRFLKERSGKQIYIACDSLSNPLVDENAAIKAAEQVYQYYEYNMMDNNCHRFIWRCFEAQENELTTFKTLSYKLAKYYNRIIYWDICDC